MNRVSKGLMLLLVLTTCAWLRADVTIGTFDTGNCDPFMCNESGSSVGQSIDYQQVFTHTAFSGPTVIGSITWNWDQADSGGVSIAIGGSYTFMWGYAAFGSVNNLNSDLALNYISGPNPLGTATIPVGGINDNPTLTFQGFAPFTYDPSLGELLLEIVVTNQDNVPNLGPPVNGYNQADDSGSVTSRAFCITGLGCGADSAGLVTTFGPQSTVPEPGSLLMLGSGMVGLAGFLRRKLSL